MVGGFNAVKVIRKKGKNTDELAGVMAECNTLNWLSHPNIVQLRGAVNAYKNFYVFMDFAGSVSLHKLLQNRQSPRHLALYGARSRMALWEALGPGKGRCLLSGSNTH